MANDSHSELISVPAAVADKLTDTLRAEVDRAWKAVQQRAAEEHVSLPRDPAFVGVLCRVFACSQFVADTCVRYPEVLRDLLDGGDLHRPYGVSEYRDYAIRRADQAGSTEELAQGFRNFRRREMLRIVWRDLAGWADLDEILRDVTGLADACVSVGLARLDQWLSREHGRPIGESGAPARMVVLAMGKQGAWELNVSSDIDLIFAYTEEGETDRAPAISNHEYFVRLGRALIQLLDQQTADGFVFRVDMRLRPFGDSGPLAVSFDAMEDYYQSQGREWERYAMVKARAIAGGIAGQRLEKILEPFVYRRYLDFGAFESLREMKGLIMRQVQRKSMEQNVKLGAGGIREVEFIGQAFQLIRGGREPALRVRAIVAVLQRLAQLDYLPRFVTDELVAGYRFLRRVENRLQAMADQQVHSLPDEATARARLAFAMGYGDWKAFVRALDRHRRKVHAHFEQVFTAPQAEEEEPGRLQDGLAGVWHGSLEPEQTLEVLRQSGFEAPADALRLLERLADDRAVRAMSARGRERLDRLMPMLLGAAGATPQPATTLVRLVHLLEAIAGRSAYLALLMENPMALSQLVQLCGASPWIALYLTQHPLLLDELLDPRSLYLPLNKEALRAELHALLGDVAASDLELHMEALRHFKQTNVLRVAAADVSDVMPLMHVSDHLTHIAEVVLEAVLDIAWDNLTARHGAPPGKRLYGGFTVVAYGKLGGIELGYGSDLDLVFLYENDDEQPTAGPRPLEQAVFFARLGQRMIHILNTMTPAGVLYEVDLRLRPSGGAGLLVSSMQGFSDYQRDDAWTWEHQALVRARPVAGDSGTADAFEALRREILTRPRDPQQLRIDVKDMRARMRAELARGTGDVFDLKQGAGGLADIEFLVQYGVLRWAAQFPDLIAYSDNIRQLEALARNGLLSADEAESLAEAYREYRRQIHRLTLQEEPALAAGDDFEDHRRLVTTLWRRWLDDAHET